MSITADNIPIHCAYDELADITTLVPNPRNQISSGSQGLLINFTVDVSKVP